MKWSAAVGRTKDIYSFTWEGFNTPLKFAPGEGWYYGSATDWAGKLLTNVIGQPLSQYMAENIFSPLGMHDTTFRPLNLPEEKKVRRVACAFRDAETGRLTMGAQPTPDDPPVESGGAGLHMSAADHARVLQALLQALSGEGGAPLVGKETIREMLRPQLSEPQQQMLKMLTDMLRVAMVPEFPPGTPVDHGIGGVLNMADVPGKRRKGSMMWAGVSNGRWVSSNSSPLLLPSVFRSSDGVLTVVGPGDGDRGHAYAQCVPSAGRGSKRALQRARAGGLW